MDRHLTYLDILSNHTGEEWDAVSIVLQTKTCCSLYQHALAICEQVLGASHRKTCETGERTCALLQALGKTEEATALETTPARRSRKPSK